MTPMRRSASLTPGSLLQAPGNDSSATASALINALPTSWPSISQRVLQKDLSQRGISLFGMYEPHLVHR